jgi:hypothetical protein
MKTSKIIDMYLEDPHSLCHMVYHDGYTFCYLTNVYENEVGEFYVKIDFINTDEHVIDTVTEYLKSEIYTCNFTFIKFDEHFKWDLLLI